MLTERRWLITIGVRRGRGGWQINGQHIIDASKSDHAFNKAYGYCDRGESILSVEDVDYDHPIEPCQPMDGSTEHDSHTF